MWEAGHIVKDSMPGLGSGYVVLLFKSLYEKSWRMLHGALVNSSSGFAI